MSEPAKAPTPEEIEAAETMSREQGENVRHRLETEEFKTDFKLAFPRQHSNPFGDGGGIAWMFVWIWDYVKNRSVLKWLFIILIIVGVFISVVAWLG